MNINLGIVRDNIKRVRDECLFLIQLSGHNKYCIKRGYLSRKKVKMWDDIKYSEEYQKEIYIIAREIMFKNKFNNVLDYGCGSGYKLVKYLGEFETIGIEVSRNIDYLRCKYPNRLWFEYDNMPKVKIDLVVSADVIEHISDPRILINAFIKIRPKIILVSTPERDMTRGIKDFGPPANPHHCREWNKLEFNMFMRRWFEIIEHSMIINGNNATQYVICRPCQVSFAIWPS